MRSNTNTYVPSAESFLVSLFYCLESTTSFMLGWLIIVLKFNINTRILWPRCIDALTIKVAHHLSCMFHTAGGRIYQAFVGCHKPGEAFFKTKKFYWHLYKHHTGNSYQGAGVLGSKSYSPFQQKIVFSIAVISLMSHCKNHGNGLKLLFHEYL